MCPWPSTSADATVDPGSAGNHSPGRGQAGRRSDVTTCSRRCSNIAHVSGWKPIILRAMCKSWYSAQHLGHDPARLTATFCPSSARRVESRRTRRARHCPRNRRRRRPGRHPRRRGTPQPRGRRVLLRVARQEAGRLPRKEFLGRLGDSPTSPASWHLSLSFTMFGGPPGGDENGGG